MNYTESYTPSASARRPLHRVYEFPTGESPASVREYLLTDIGDRRCCILRWTKNFEFEISGMTFEISEFDKDSALLDKKTVTLDASELPPVSNGEVFTTSGAVSVSPLTDIVRVDLLEVRSGEYVYTKTKSGFSESYTLTAPWKQDRESRKAAKMAKSLGEYTSRTVRSKRTVKVGKTWLFSVISLLVISTVVLTPYILRIFPIERMLDEAIEEVSEFIESVEEDIKESREQRAIERAEKKARREAERAEKEAAGATT